MAVTGMFDGDFALPGGGLSVEVWGSQTTVVSSGTWTAAEGALVIRSGQIVLTNSGQILPMGQAGDRVLTLLGDRVELTNSGTIGGRVWIGGASRVVNTGQMADVQLGSTSADVTNAGQMGSVLLSPGDDIYRETGAGRSDYVLASDGNDLLQGGRSSSHMMGGAGRDTLEGGSGSDRLFGEKGADVLRAGGGMNLLSGGDGADRISSGAGSDYLFGGRGQDLITGGAWDDDLSGGGGCDRLAGGSGNDTLEGGWGADTMSGGLGADRFLFTARSGGQDRIRDFHGGEDVIHLGRALTLVAEFSGHAGEVRIAAPDRIEGDRDGDGGADWQALFLGSVTLTLADFV